MDKRFDKWNLCCRVEPLTTVARELAKYKLRFSGSTGGRLDRWHQTTFSFMEMRIRIMNYGQEFSYIRESY
jgi:hypothetical protein